MRCYRLEVASTRVVSIRYVRIITFAALSTLLARPNIYIYIYSHLEPFWSLYILLYKKKKKKKKRNANLVIYSILYNPFLPSLLNASTQVTFSLFTLDPFGLIETIFALYTSFSLPYIALSLSLSLRRYSSTVLECCHYTVYTIFVYVYIAMQHHARRITSIDHYEWRRRIFYFKDRQCVYIKKYSRK